MKLNHFRIIFIISNIVLVSLLYFIDYTFTSKYMIYFEIYILFVFSVLFYFNIKYYGFFHILVFFHFTFFLFVFGKVPGDLFNESNMNEFLSLVNIYFDNESLIEGLLISLLSLLIINLFSIIFIVKEIAPIKSNSRYISIGKKIMITTFPLLFIKLYVEYNYIATIGYYAYYAGGAVSVVYPYAFIGFSQSLFLFGYFIFISGIPKQKEFTIYSLIFIMLMVIDALKGSRSSIILPILFYFWFLGNFYTIDVVKYVKKFIIFSIILISFSQFYAHYRMETNESFDTSKILSFLTDQGRSISVISLYIENKKNLNETTLGYIFEPLTFPYYYIFYHEKVGDGQSINTVNIRENLNHRLTFYLNETFYLKGFGLGSSYIAEMYEFGYLGVVVFSILLTFLIGILYTYTYYRIVVFLSYIIVSHIFVISRAEYFIGLWPIIKYSILYFTIFFILNVLQSYKRGRVLNV